MGILGLITFPDTARSLGSQSLAWGERNCDWYWEMGRGDAKLSADLGHQHTPKPHRRLAAFLGGIPGFTGWDIKAESD